MTDQIKLNDERNKSRNELVLGDEWKTFYNKKKVFWCFSHLNFLFSISVAFEKDKYKEKYKCGHLRLPD